MLAPGKIVQIHGYKHNKRLHRIWCVGTVLHEDDDVLVVANNKTRVIESNGRCWTTREPAICYFFKNNWYNVIAMLKSDGIHYYCNLSSPYVYDGEAIKYIDYDLDVRVSPTYSYNVLDEDEYNIHKVKMEYPEEIQRIVENELNVLIKRIKRRVGPFDSRDVKKWYDLYKKMR